MQNNTSASTKGIRGRRGALQETRDLINLLGSLSHEGDTIDARVISQRMGISREEAKKFLTILETVGVEENAPLTVYSNSQGQLTLAFEQGIHGVPLRLSKTETFALNAALNYLHVPTDDSLRVKLNRAYGARSVNQEDVMRAISPSDSSDVCSYLTVIAQAIVSDRIIRMCYRGAKDTEARMRIIRPLYLQRNDTSWFLRGLDLEIDSERTFRLDRITSCGIEADGRSRSIIPGKSLDNTSVTQGKTKQDSTPNQDQTRIVTLRFLDDESLRKFSWPGITSIHKQDGCITAAIPYYGNHSPWLPRQIAACAGKVRCDDAEVTSLTRDYATQLLESLDALTQDNA